LPVDDPRMIKAKGDQLYELLQPFAFVSKQWGTIEVPIGFVTNFASVPKSLRNIVDDDDPCILYGSVIHDWLYTNKGTWSDYKITRSACDEVLCEAMALCHADTWKILAVRSTLQIFGAAHWGDQ